MPSIPHITLVEFHMVFSQNLTILLFERLGAMVLFLAVYVAYQLFQLTPADGEAAVAALPKTSTVLAALAFDPGRRGLFDHFKQLRLADSAGQSGRQVDMIGGAADTIGLAVTVTADRRQIGVHARADFQVEPRMALFGAEDDVQDDLAEGLRHMACRVCRIIGAKTSEPTMGQRYEAGRWPAMTNLSINPGRCPGLI